MKEQKYISHCVSDVLKTLGVCLDGSELARKQTQSERVYQANLIWKRRAAEETERLCYFGFLLTGPTGTAINNLVQCLTWDLVPGGDILAGFDAQRAPSPPPFSPPQFLSSP